MLGSLSKTYAMTGWRAGFALGPKQIISAMSKLQSQSTSNTTSFVQKAAVAALTSSQACVAEMRADLHEAARPDSGRAQDDPRADLHGAAGRVLCVSECERVHRQGRIEVGVRTWQSKLLTEAHVVVVPGEAFGTTEHVRLSYAVSAGRGGQGRGADAGVLRQVELGSLQALAGARVGTGPHIAGRCSIFPLT